MNATIERFGYPATLIAQYSHWLVLLRPAQPTLGSLVLAARSNATAFADLALPAFAELGKVVADIEAVLRRAIAFDRVNYLMLMMVDPHVHFHVVPRYDGKRTCRGLTIADAGWPKLPDLSAVIALDDDQTAGLVEWLSADWPSGR